MKINKYGLMGLVAGALVFGATTGVMAVPPPPPPGVQLMPGMMWCPRCGGNGRVPSGFMGWHDKRCPECKGRGMLMVRPAPPPPPPPAVHHHPAPPPPAAHRQPAPAPVRHPGAKPGHKGGPGPR